MAPSRKNSVGKERRARSRSPATRSQSIRIREELRSRTPRGSSNSSSHNHKIPIDCPFPRCVATTVHQHHNNLQFFNPHPANEVRYRGYVSSQRVTPPESNVANGGPARQGQETSEPETSDNDNATKEPQEPDDDVQTPVMDDDETDDREEPTERRSLIITVKVGTPEERNDAPRSVALADVPKEQQDVVLLDRAAPEGYTTMDNGISDLSPNDPITSRRTLDFVEDLITGPQTIPMEIDYETFGNAWDSRGMEEEPDEAQMQSVFDEWLVPNTPEQASETLPYDI